MTNKAYEMLMEILSQRCEEWKKEDCKIAFTYENVKNMVMLAQEDNLECLAQYLH